jgi:hypothetical protein
MTKEQKFYIALKDVFVGAKVEGESGYINLMRIKSRYYERRLPETSGRYHLIYKYLLIS